MAKKSKTNGMTRYTTYNWVDHDPVLDWLDTAQKDSGYTDAEMCAASKVARGTRRSWRMRKTKRPQFTTVAAYAVAIGVDSVPITPEARRRLRAQLKE